MWPILSFSNPLVLIMVDVTSAAAGNLSPTTRSTVHPLLHSPEEVFWQVSNANYLFNKKAKNNNRNVVWYFDRLAMVLTTDCQ
jgi:hypothetical protein